MNVTLQSTILKTDSPRDEYIDSLKGIAILLVVIGHSIQYNILDFDNNVAFRIIYSFHMPLFIFLSGYLTYGKIKNPLHEWVKNKFYRLVIPFVAWGVFIKLQKFQSESFTMFFYHLFKNPDIGLWFFWVLFLCYCLLGAVLSYDDKYKNIRIVVTCAILYFLDINTYGVGFLKWLFPFFVAGYAINEYKGKISKCIKPVAVLLAVLFPIIVGYWNRLDNPTLNPAIYTTFSFFLNSNAINLIYRYLVAFAGISLIAVLIKIFNRFNLPFDQLGTYTFDIYAIHLFFLWGVGDGYLRIFSVILIALSISLIVSYILRKFSITSILFLGQLTPSK